MFIYNTTRLQVSISRWKRKAYEIKMAAMASKAADVEIAM